MSSRVSSGPASAETVALLERGPLYAFAYLLTGDRARAASLTDDALTRTPSDPSGHRDAVVLRARVASRARKPRPAPDAPPVVRALAACSHEERTALICVVHERMTIAEAAFVVRRTSDQIDALVVRGAASVAAAIGGRGVSEANAQAVVRMELLAATADLGEPEPASNATHRARPVTVGSVLVAVVIVAAWMTRSSATDGTAHGPEVFHSARGGYRITIDAGWRSLPTDAGPSDAGADPARLGLASRLGADDTAVFIPRVARERPAMLRITVTRRFYDDAVALVREQLDEQRGTVGLHVAAVERVTFAGRPGELFRLAYPDDHAMCPGCRSVTRVVHWFGGTTMIVEEPGPHAAPRAMVASLAPASGLDPYEPAAGTAKAHLEASEHLETLLRFLDARATNGDPLRWLADDAGMAATSLGGVLDYEVTGRAGGAFIVRVKITDRFGRRRELLEERITVGEGMRLGRAWPSVVRRIDVRSL